MTEKLNTLRSNMLGAAYNHARAHVEKHRVNIEVYLTNPVGVGEHSDVMDAIEKELEEMAKYEDHMDILDRYFKE
jgi:selenophosphate synthase